MNKASDTVNTAMMKVDRKKLLQEKGRNMKDKERKGKKWEGNLIK